jgi:hypothetical protein
VVAGTTAVAARLDKPRKNTATGSLVAAGGLVGGAAGFVLATAYAPDYIRDNVALFRIGAMSIGALEGAAIGAAAFPNKFTAAWTGGLLGLGAGAVAGVLLDDHAPNYGRVTVIESAAAMGALSGALVFTAVRPQYADKDKRDDYKRRYQPLFVLGGLNVGLGAGLALAYLPDQRARGPSWKRVALIDLATAAGAFAGAVATTINNCLANDPDDCGFASDQRTARFALAGGALGLAAGWVLTRNLDRNSTAPADHHEVGLLPLPAAIPVQGRDGPTVVPGLAAQGRF